MFLGLQKINKSFNCNKKQKFKLKNKITIMEEKKNFYCVTKLKTLLENCTGIRV